MKTKHFNSIDPFLLNGAGSVAASKAVKSGQLFYGNGSAAWKKPQNDSKDRRKNGGVVDKGAVFVDRKCDYNASKKPSKKTLDMTSYLFGTVWGAGTGDECDTVADDSGVLNEDALRVEFVRWKLDDVHAKLAQEAAKSFVLSARLL